MKPVLRVFKKHATQNRFWNYFVGEYSTFEYLKEMAKDNGKSINLLVIDHNGRDITKEFLK